MDQRHIVLAHGSGGRLHHQLIDEVFHTKLANPWLDQKLDAAKLDLPTSGKIVFSTDSFVIDPLFFPGGDIGCLAVYGTVNDLAVSGGVPKYLSAGFIIEEGLLIDDLIKVVDSMQRAAAEAGVAVVTGDTKVVGRGQVDKLFINTAGIGVVAPGIDLCPTNMKNGDLVIISGGLGEHGLAIMAQREGISFKTTVNSDCGSVHRLAAALLEIDPAGVRCMRDPTRGGLATTLNELAHQGSIGIRIEEDIIPVLPTVRGGCEMLGIDPLYMANEGKLIAVVAAERAQEMLQSLRDLPEGRNAAIIGEINQSYKNLVLLHTSLGTDRVLGMLEGELLPRIC